MYPAINGHIDTKPIFDEQGQFVRRRFVWQGGEPARIDHMCFGYEVKWDKQDTHIGDVLTIGEFRVRVVAKDHSIDGLIVVRDGWKARVYVLIFRLAHPVESVYHRIILTLAIWGLARWDEVRPSWRNIHALRWIAERVKR